MASRVSGRSTTWRKVLNIAGLGPVVAALSLGASATMSFRPKTRGSNKSQNHMKAVKQARTKEAKEGSGGGSVLNLTLSHGVSRRSCSG